MQRPSVKGLVGVDNGPWTLVESRQPSVKTVMSALERVTTKHKPIVLLRGKLVIVGDAKVGKTALVQMIHRGFWAKSYIMTVGVDFCVKAIPIPDSSTIVELYMMDTAGQGIFNKRDLASRYWENGSMVMVVYDVSNRDSFTSCVRWLRGVTEARRGRPMLGVLVANKIDLVDLDRAVVSSEEGRAFAEEHGLAFFETSAAAGRDVDAPFNYLASAYFDKYEKKRSAYAAEELVDDLE